MLSFQYDRDVPVKIETEFTCSSPNRCAKWPSTNLETSLKLLKSIEICISPTNCSCNETRKTSKMVTYNVTVHRDFILESSDTCIKLIPFFERRKDSSWLQPLDWWHTGFKFFCVQRSICSPCI